MICLEGEKVQFGLVIGVVVSPAAEFGDLFGQHNASSVICVQCKTRRSENALSVSNGQTLTSAILVPTPSPQSNSAMIVSELFFSILPLRRRDLRPVGLVGSFAESGIGAPRGCERGTLEPGGSEMEVEVGRRSSLLSCSTTEVIASDMLVDNQFKDVFAKSSKGLSDSE